MNNHAQALHGLSEHQLATLKKILIPFSSHITGVGLFGSRATGRYKPYSDIDLVLYGTLDEAIADRIHTLLNDSDLSIKVDIQVYHLIDHATLKEHIDQVKLLLWTQKDLS